MAESETLRNPVLVAVWPGMGGVALTAGGYLVEKLGATLVGELPTSGLFELEHVTVENGVVKSDRMPRSLFFQWKNPDGDRDLLIFVGEAQPSKGGYALCQQVLDYAVQRGVGQFFTFAAMATQLHPSSRPRVFGVATGKPMLKDLRDRDVEILDSGQISGLNGVLLHAGGARGLAGTCLMGELPFFAARVPNPRASQAVLEIFCSTVGIELDLDPIRAQAVSVEKHLLKMLEQMKQAVRQQGEADEEAEFSTPEFAADEEENEDEAPATPAEPELDAATRQRIETMFRHATEDRDRAFQLKELLDRHGVFERYEDRFLDLFRKAD